MAKRAAPYEPNLADDELLRRRLKQRIDGQVLPLLAAGLKQSRSKRKPPSTNRSVPLPAVEQAAFAWLLRLLAALFAESRSLLVDMYGDNAEAAPSDRCDRLLTTCRRLDQAGDGAPGFSAPAEKLPTACAQAALAALLRDSDQPAAAIDFSRLPVRWLGSLYEGWLAGHQLTRKQQGAFYTSEQVVQRTIELALLPQLDQVLAELGRKQSQNSGSPGKALDMALEELRTFRVLDPAMGSGHFLVAAMNSIAERLWNWAHADAAPGESGKSLTLVKQEVLKRAVFGVDRDPVAVDLARWSLWLEAGGGREVLSPLRQNLRCGDALLGEAGELDSEASLHGAGHFHWRREFPHCFPDSCPRNSGRSGFACIVGNPPYGARLDAAEKKLLVRRLPQMKHNADTAVGFIERASELLADDGRCGLIVPKPFTYSYAWRQMRGFLDRRVLHLVDLGRAWKEVRLEQVILVFGRLANQQGYGYDASNGDRRVAALQMPRSIYRRFDCLPCSLDPHERCRLDRLRLSDVTVGDLCKTFRGLPLQRQLQPAGSRAVLAGRDLQRWGAGAASGFLPAGDEQDRFAAFAREKLVFQNIIAHVERPRPHILLIGARDLQQRVTLDTVNNLVPRQSPLNLSGLLGLLHSEPINWFVYSVVYNRAIRTMHFDQYFLDKIPLPLEHEALFERLAPQVAVCEQATASLAASVDAYRAALQTQGVACMAKSALKRLLLDESAQTESWRDTATRAIEARSQALRTLNAEVETAYLGAPEPVA